jgi:hypothetical protein
MSFSSGVSFRASLVPAAILSNVSLDDVGMMDDDDDDREESHESRSGFETVLAVSEEPSGTEKMELPIEDIVIPNTSSPVALTPHITEEQLVEAIREIRDGNTLSIGDSLKDWKEAIAMKLNLGAPLAKTWNPTIIQELAPKAKPSSPTRDDEVAKESDLESEHGGSSTALDVEADEKNPTINEELAVSDPGLSSLTFSQVVQALQQAVVSKRTTAVLELLERDEVEIEKKSELLRNSLLLRVKQRTQPHVEHFRREIDALKSVKQAMRAEGLLDAFSVIAQEKGLNVEEGDSEGESGSGSEAGAGGMIALSDEENSDGDSEGEDATQPSVPVAKLPPSLCGGHIKTVLRARGNSARLSLKSRLQHKTLLQSSEVVAKRFGLTNSHDLVTVLGGMELER